MRPRPLFFILIATLLLASSPMAALPVAAQRADPLVTPLPEDLLLMLADEISGQDAFDNMVKLAGAPWLRAPEELRGESNFYESEELYRLVLAYGIETVRLDRYEAPGSFTYPMEGDLRVDGRRLARIPGDPALVARGSQTGEVSGRLIYVPQIPEDQLSALQEAIASTPNRYRGATALMWTHPRGELFRILDQAGVNAVISFSSRERYLDPDQVVYSGGGYGQGQNLRLGMTVSWRQWSELLEDVERGEEILVEARAVMESFPSRLETVYAWIPGTEPDLPGVVYTGHLFEGYTKRGANDNVGGPAVQLEILRALHRLIETGMLPQPRRTLHFIWPDEYSGTYEFLRRDPGLLERLAININMDMVSEALRKNNGIFAMSETPPHLASFFDGLAHAVMDYVWRTNDIVYPYPVSPRDRSGGQYFLRPLWEKNGSRDAFRFYTHETTGQSDHEVFNSASVAVPGVHFFVWPDQWYHADKDLPENADPTTMRRVAFIGAATGLVSANLSDEMAPALLDAVSDFGYARLAQRVIPRAMERLDTDGEIGLAWPVLAAGVDREMDAIRSVNQISTGSSRAKALVEARLAEWQGFREGLEVFLLQAARARGIRVSGIPGPSAAELGAFDVTPALAEGIRGQEFSLPDFGPMQAYLQDHPGILEALGLSQSQTTQIVNFVNGRRSVGEILLRVRGVTAEPLTLDQLQGYLEILQEVGWISLG
jgi:hypothetical protein